ncbi:MAG: hypothetical protein NTW25_08680 [Candidatus Kapabacteria bacterium]|nr:hypothetical protein [Candidatus Kapabacteria bacterium]
MSEFSIKLIIILIPGIIATKIVWMLTSNQNNSKFNFIISAILYGVFSYLLFQIVSFIGIYSLLNFIFNTHYNYTSLKIWGLNSHKIYYDEVMWASFFSIIVGLLITLSDNYKILNKFAKKLRISNKFGDENLYSYFLNSKEIDYVYIRNIKNNITYYGRVNAYSENKTDCEIVLLEVSIYRYEDSILLYEVDQIYLSFNRSELIIEHSLKKEKIND